MEIISSHTLTVTDNPALTARLQEVSNGKLTIFYLVLGYGGTEYRTALWDDDTNPDASSLAKVSYFLARYNRRGAADLCRYFIGRSKNPLLDQIFQPLLEQA